MTPRRLVLLALLAAAAGCSLTVPTCTAGCPKGLVCGAGGTCVAVGDAGTTGASATGGAGQGSSSGGGSSGAATSSGTVTGASSSGTSGSSGLSGASGSTGSSGSAGSGSSTGSSSSSGSAPSGGSSSSGGPVVQVLAGTGKPGFANGPDATAQFNGPIGIAVDGAGNVYVADTLNNCVRVIEATGSVATLAGLCGTDGGEVDGDVANAQFAWPSGVALDDAGNLYVADQGLVNLSENGAVRLITDGGTSTLDQSFVTPWGIALAGNTLYVSDTGYNFGGGAVMELIGNDNTPDVIKLPNTVFGLVANEAGELFAAEADDDMVVVVMPDGGSWTLAGYAQGLHSPFGVALDAAGDLLIADTGNRCIRILPEDGGGMGTFAGSCGSSASAFSAPEGLAVDPAGNVYVSDMGANQVLVIRAQ